MDYELRFTNKEITAWGNMGLMKRMLDRIGFNAAVASCGLLCADSVAVAVHAVGVVWRKPIRTYGSHTA